MHGDLEVRNIVPVIVAKKRNKEKQHDKLQEKKLHSQFLNKKR